jgi:[ribosomal protein S5]-alanine N-acetyltransferase
VSSAGPDEWLGLPLPELRIDQGPLSLRPWRPDDAHVLAAAWDDPLVRQWLEPPTGGASVAATWIAGAEHRLAGGTAIDAAIVVDGAVAGEIGLHRFDRRRRAALVGYWVGPGHRGRGLAATALAAATRWWFDTVDGMALVAECASANVASWRTAEVAGFTLLEERDGRRVLAIVRSGGGAPAPVGPEGP